MWQWAQPPEMPLLKMLCTNVTIFVREESLGFLCAALALTLRWFQNAGQWVDRGGVKLDSFPPCGDLAFRQVVPLKASVADECLCTAAAKNGGTWCRLQ